MKTIMGMLVALILVAGAVFGVGHAQDSDDPFANLGPAGQLSLTSGPWQMGEPLPEARAGLNAVSLDGLIYAAGGAGLVAPRDEFTVFDPELGRWRNLDSLPEGLERFGMAVFMGRIYIAGGFHTQEVEESSNPFAQEQAAGTEPTRAMWSYGPEEGKWRSEADMPGPKTAFSLLAVNDKLYAIGAGQAGVYEFDADAELWDAIEAPQEVNRPGAGGIVWQDKIYILGGVLNGKATSRVDVYDPQTRQWSLGTALPQARAGHAIALYNNALHVMGGRNEDLSITLNDHLILAPGADHWQSAPGLITPRTDAAAVSVGEALYLIGGGAGSGFFAPFTAMRSVDIFTANR
ncbi:Kelch repeat-containing protein [Woodsholea maritima]|uniref:Kelch repeat-containing protein n=1 Tax=Woodsholea maritima TaxID=240237 RepID=UPI0003710365|nr:kelch repeat-containing protein [Woodsholea maritima]